MDCLIGENGMVQESDISQLPYLQAVLKETFRLHPAAPFLVPRKAEADMEVLGFMVPKDTQVLVNVWTIGRDPRVWENPTRFEPERFLGKETDVKGRDYELTPFGGGRRICPGLPLAVVTVLLMLASLLYFFDWKLPNGVASEDLDMDETFAIISSQLTSYGSRMEEERIPFGSKTEENPRMSTVETTDRSRLAN
ncbi:unnamed protein product [Brassica oleracea]|uniref:(rape) hypothetical protein n=1 Tax=Brassica napus TaxID=3708 RepID=A0A816JZZ3_BRANA|nr:unnamed protein product [Brassica napus]